MGFLDGPYSRKSFRSTLIDELLASVVPALIFQVAGFWIAEHLFHTRVDLKLVYSLITGSEIEKLPGSAWDEIRASLPAYLYYNLCMLASAWLVGKGVRWAVVHWNLDIRFHFLRFNNDWYYLLSGRILDFPNISGEVVGEFFITVNAIVETGGEGYLYRGVLEDYYFSTDGGLDRIYISNVYRRRLDSDRDPHARIKPVEQDERYVFVDGDLFCILQAHIKTLNVNYIGVNITPAGQADTAQPSG